MAKLYVGNIPWRATEQELEALFSEVGTVRSVSIIKDPETGRSRGFGFVELTEADVSEAITRLDGTELGGRQLKVSEARQRQGGSGR